MWTTVAAGLPSCWLVVALALLSTGCASQGPWPSWQQWRDSAVNTAGSPATWAPLLAAAVVKATDRDQSLSDYAHEQQPLYGSNANADRVADDGILALSVLAVGSALLTPPAAAGDADANWSERGERVAVLLLAHSAADGTSGWLKGVFDRTRPNGRDKGMPSGHATEAFAYATEAARNIDDLGWSPAQQWWWNVGMYSIASGVAWARVEVQAHYSTDVLVGASVGHFVAGWLYDVYLNSRYPNSRLKLVPVVDGVWLQWSASF